MRWAYGKDGERQKHIHYFKLGDLLRNSHLEDLRGYERIILKQTLGK
jgi:hypothetical protein